MKQETDEKGNTLTYWGGLEKPKQETLKQTAVEYLYKIIHARIHIDKDLSEYLEQAKEMEKQQMFEYIKNNYVNGENSLKFHQEEFEQYYKENYKS